MWLGLVLFSCVAVCVHARAGLLGGSLLPTASLDVFKTSSKAAQHEDSGATQTGCTLLDGRCSGNTNLVKQTSNTLDTINIHGKAGIPLTNLEADAKLSANPTKVNASALIHKVDEEHKQEKGNQVSEGTRVGEAHEAKPTECLETVTTVNGKPSCKGKLVFEDIFDTLSKEKWEHVIEFAGSPDYEFVVYSDDNKNSYVTNGKLYIKPTLLADDGLDITTATLELPGCTGTKGSQECKKTAVARDILPPVKSARLRTKKSFSFQYGNVEVQAKLPAGDWIFPEIWLEPKSNSYGSNRYESGLIQLAVVRGNRNLILDNKEVGARHLAVECIIGIGKVIHRETFTTDSIGLWSNEFHLYGVTWTPDYISFTIDGKEIGKVTPPQEGFKKLASFSALQVPWARGNKIAPFDQEFYISLGVGAGGFQMFPDNSITNEHPKPWKDKNVKAMLLFWKDKDSWYPTWSEDSSLQVEHVKVWAL